MFFVFSSTVYSTENKDTIDGSTNTNTHIPQEEIIQEDNPDINININQDSENITKPSNTELQLFQDLVNKETTEELETDKTKVYLEENNLNTKPSDNLENNPPSWSKERAQYDRDEISCYLDRPERLNNELIKIVLHHAPEKIKSILGSLWYNNRNICSKILLIGEPGTGKTTLAIALAQILRDKALLENKYFSFYLIDGPQLAGEVQNSGERNLKRAFNTALAESNENCVIIIDELDKLIAPPQNAKGKHDQGVAQAFNTLLNNCLNKPNVVIIGITNNLDVFPPALKSRFRENTIEIKMPDTPMRRDIIEYYLKIFTSNLSKECFQSKDSTELDKKFLDQLAKESVRMSARDISEAIYELVSACTPSFNEQCLDKVWEDLNIRKSFSFHEKEPYKFEQPSNKSLITKTQIIKKIREKRISRFGWVLNKAKEFKNEYGAQIAINVISNVVNNLVGIGPNIIAHLCNQVAQNCWLNINLKLSNRYNWWPSRWLAGDTLLQHKLLKIQAKDAKRNIERAERQALLMNREHNWKAHDILYNHYTSTVISKADYEAIEAWLECPEFLPNLNKTSTLYYAFAYLAYLEKHGKIKDLKYKQSYAGILQYLDKKKEEQK